MNDPQPLDYATPRPAPPSSRAWQLISDYFPFFCLWLLALFFLVFGLLAAFFHDRAYGQ